MLTVVCVCMLHLGMYKCVAFIRETATMTLLFALPTELTFLPTHIAKPLSQKIIPSTLNSVEDSEAAVKFEDKARFARAALKLNL